jgi:hypothetical protein
MARDDRDQGATLRDLRRAGPRFRSASGQENRRHVNNPPQPLFLVATRCAMREALMDHQLELARSDSDGWVI